MGGSDGYPTSCMCLVTLNCRLKKWLNGKFYVMYILPRWEKKAHVWNGNRAFELLCIIKLDARWDLYRIIKVINLRRLH